MVSTVTVAVQCGETKTRMGLCTTRYLSSNNSFAISSNYMFVNNKHSSNSTTRVIIHNSDSSSCINSKVIGSSC